VEVSGVRIGTPTERAERLLHQRAFSGCTDAISIQTKHTGLTVSLAGGKLHIVGTKHYLAGGHVDGFYLHGLRDPSVTDCD